MSTAVSGLPTMGPADPMVTLDSLDDAEFTQLCADDPKAARELIRGLALKISPDALAQMYKKLTMDATAPADVIKIAGEIFSIAGVRQAAQEVGIAEPKFTVNIVLGDPPKPSPMIDITPGKGSQFDDIVLRRE